jgi:hypothetical protein
VTTLTETTVLGAEHKRPRMKQISGMVVHVRLGLVMAIAGVAAAIAALAAALVGSSPQTALASLVVAIVLSGVGVWTGIWGVIRYGLFTEGCGVGTLAAERHLSRFAYWAGVISQLALMIVVVAALILLVRSIA